MICNDVGSLSITYNNNNFRKSVHTVEFGLSRLITIISTKNVFKFANYYNTIDMQTKKNIVPFISKKTKINTISGPNTNYQSISYMPNLTTCGHLMLPKKDLTENNCNHVAF
jgi:hypothetical protein